MVSTLFRTTRCSEEMSCLLLNNKCKCLTSSKSLHWKDIFFITLILNDLNVLLILNPWSVIIVSERVIYL